MSNVFPFPAHVVERRRRRRESYARDLLETIVAELARGVRGVPARSPRLHEERRRK